MTASEWDWTLRVLDHVDLNASDYTARFVQISRALITPRSSPVGIRDVIDSYNPPSIDHVRE